MIERMWGSIQRARLAEIGGVVLFLLGAGGPLGAQEAERGEPEVRRVRTIETARFGVEHPAGLAFSRRADRFVVLSAGAGSAPAELHLLGTEGRESRGLALGTAVPDPLNVTFDNKAHRLVFHDARRGQLVEVSAGRDGVPDAADLTRHAFAGHGILEPAGMSSDPVTGRLFLLDAAGPRLVVIEPEVEGGLRGAQVTVHGLAGLPGAPLRGLAFDPASGNLHAYQPETARLYGFTPTGLLVDNRDLAPAALGETRAMVFAPSGDGTDDPELTTLYVAEVGVPSTPKTRRIDERSSPGRASGRARAGRITEVTIAPRGGPTIAASVTATLVQVIDTSQFNPPSPDAMGIAFIDIWGTLLMSDSEVEEIPALFTGDNLYEVNQVTGSLLSTATTISYSGEPVGVAFDPVTPRIFISDDKFGGFLFVIERGPDNTFLTSDDDVTQLSTGAFGSDDPEGATFHRGRRSVFLADGGDAEVYEWDPGPNEQFGDGDDTISSFDTASAGAQDPEGITYDLVSGNLYVCGVSSDFLYEFTPDGTFVRTIDITAADPPEPSGLAYGPHSQNPSQASVYITDRGIDNSVDPEENDGQIFEVTFGGATPGNQPPIVSAGPDLTITLPSTAFLDGDVMDDPTQTLTIQWSEVSGPGTVNFASPNTEDTNASFSAPGTYIVRLTADDGELSASDDATVTVNPDPGPGGSNVIDIEVTAVSDDAEEDSTGGVTLGSPDLELVEDGAENQVVGIRFASVPIPPGATVTKSYLQFQVDETGSAPTALTIRGEASDDPPTFTSATENISSRTPTAAASPTWNPAPWTTQGEAGPDQQSTDLSAVLNEILARPGWASGNAMAFIVTGTGVRTAESENGDGGPTLHVEYTTGTPNTPPVVTITAPANGAMFNEGASVAFAGSAIDPEDGDISASLTWTSSIDGAIGMGASFSRSDLTPGTHVITATAIDSGGASGSDQITIQVIPTNSPPVVTITSPANGAMFNEGTSIGFAGTAIDPEDGDISANLTWTSDLDGSIGSGASFSTSGLTPGTHLITASVTDSGGASGSDQITIEVIPDNAPPVVTITSPANGAMFVEGASIGFAGTAIDPEDGDISANLTWTSSIDGSIGTGASFSVSSLSVGTHLITAMVVDSGGAGGSDQITIEVLSTNSPPVVTITSPANGAMFTEGTSVSFAGTAIDPEDGDISANLTWTSSIDGSIGTGASFSRSDLTAGTHLITAMATDSGGMSGSDQVTLQVLPTNPSTVVIDIEVVAGNDDAEEDEAGAISLGSSDLELVHEGQDDQTVGIRFVNVPIPQGASVTKSYLQFETDEIGSDPTSLTIRGQAADNPPGFSSTAFDISSRPTTTAASPVWNPAPWTTVGEAGPDQRSTDLSAVLGEIVARPGWASGNALALIVTGTGVRTAASENGAGGPTLHVEYFTNSAPVVTITSPANGSMFNEGASIGFAGTAIDPEDGDISSSLAWTSSIDGAIGTGASFSTSGLSFGTHLITAMATDSGGASGSDQITIEVIPDNYPPVVTITSPANGSAFDVGTSISFAGTAIDVEDGDISAALMWTSSIDGAIGAGASFSTSALSLGTHLITAMVTDSGGAGGSDQVTVEVTPPNMPPVVTITSPASGSMFNEFTSIAFAGSAIDPEDGDISASLVWTSSIDGAIGTGASFSTSSLSAGTHLITAMVVDSRGAGASDQVNIEVLPNNPPVVTITSPANGASFNEFTSIAFAGSAIDPEDGDISAGLGWTSSIDGSIGAGASFSTSSLSPGTHLITASVIDSGGASASDQVTIEVLANNPPVVTITSPSNGAMITEGSIAFAGSAIDPEDGDISANLTWTSSVEGAIGTGPSFSRSDLTAGTHLITASATDSGGASGSAQITIQVLPANPSTVVVDLEVVAGNDDAEEDEVGAIARGSSDLELIRDGASDQIVGIRYVNVPVPQGAYITKSFVQFVVDEPDSDPTSLTVRGQAADDAPAFTSTTYDISSRPITAAASPTWSPVPWTTVGETGRDQRSTDLSAVLGEIVGRPGWASGNALVLIVTGTGVRTAESENGTGGPTLHVEYTPNLPPTVVIASPPHRAKFAQGASFAGFASDPEDGDISADIQWTSSVNGALGTGASFSRPNLSSGTHRITATVFDSRGTSGSDQITIHVAPAPRPVVRDLGLTAEDD